MSKNKLYVFPFYLNIRSWVGKGDCCKGFLGGIVNLAEVIQLHF